MHDPSVLNKYVRDWKMIERRKHLKKDGRDKEREEYGSLARSKRPPETTVD